MNKLNITCICLLFFLLGCSSAPKRDDYALHVKLDSQLINSNLTPTFKIDKDSPLDIRGEYSSDDSLNSISILYQGGAGVLGFLVQIATHAAINNSSRNSKLSESQLVANEFILHITSSMKDLTLEDLIDDDTEEYKINRTDQEIQYQAKIYPIFFVTPNFEYISIKNIVRIENKNTKNKKIRASQKKVSKSHYQNLIEVYSRKYSKEERDLFQKSEDHSFFSDELKKLLKQSLRLAAREIKGRYEANNSKLASFKLEKGNGDKYIRAREVDTLCNKIVLQNLRSWLIAIPSTEILTDSNCNEKYAQKAIK